MKEPPKFKMGARVCWINKSYNLAVAGTIFSIEYEKGDNKYHYKAEDPQGFIKNFSEEELYELFD